MAKHNEWMSVSDLMTGLMIIFLFITVAYMNRVNDRRHLIDQYVETMQNLHDELNVEFRIEISKGDVTLERDLTLKFNNTSGLFNSGEWELSNSFMERLNSFLPRYLNILLHSQFKNQIKEIRIEGHTDMHPYPSLNDDPYIANIILSQRRALSILKHMRKMPFYLEMPKEDQSQLEFWFTANGFAYGRTLDENGNYSYLSQSPVNDEKSRRVEFRVVTNGDDIIKDFVSRNK